MRQTIRLLSIDLRGTSQAVRDAFTPGREELADLSARARAAAAGAELVVLVHTDRFEVYTTEEARQTVFRSVLGPLVARVPNAERVGIRTSEIVGVAAAWHLLHLVVDSGAQSGVRTLGALNTAVERARAAGTLGPELSALFHCAADAGWRVQGETMLGDATSSPGVRELDRLEAERIIEEELVTWQAARAGQGVVQSIPASRLDPSYYAANEPGSSIRLKAPHLRSMSNPAFAKLA